jgi:hypothetical protein
VNEAIGRYHEDLEPGDRVICERLAAAIERGLPGAEGKVWHAHPVWFLDGNPIVGYAKRKDSVRLMFWSGQSFDEPDLEHEGTFKAAQARYTAAEQIDEVLGGRASAEAEPHAGRHEFERAGGSLLLEIVGAHGVVLNATSWPAQRSDPTGGALAAPGSPRRDVPAMTADAAGFKPRGHPSACI